MNSPAPRFEIPLRPGVTQPFLPGRGVTPGPLRGVYNPNNRKVYDPVYHDPTKLPPLDFSRCTSHSGTTPALPRPCPE